MPNEISDLSSLAKQTISYRLPVSPSIAIWRSVIYADMLQNANMVGLSEGLTTPIETDRDSYLLGDLLFSASLDS